MLRFLTPTVPPFRLQSRLTPPQLLASLELLTEPISSPLFYDPFDTRPLRGGFDAGGFRLAVRRSVPGQKLPVPTWLGRFEPGGEGVAIHVSFGGDPRGTLLLALLLAMPFLTLGFVLQGAAANPEAFLRVATPAGIAAFFALEGVLIAMFFLARWLVRMNLVAERRRVRDAFGRYLMAEAEGGE